MNDGILNNLPNLVNDVGSHANEILPMDPPDPPIRPSLIKNKNFICHIKTPFNLAIIGDAFLSFEIPIKLCAKTNSLKQTEYYVVSDLLRNIREYHQQRIHRPKSPLLTFVVEHLVFPNGQDLNHNKPSGKCEFKDDEFGSIVYFNVNWEHVMRDTNTLNRQIFRGLEIEINKCWTKEEMKWCEMTLFLTDPKYYVNSNYNVIMIGLDHLLKWYGQKKTNRLGKEFDAMVDSVRVIKEFKSLWPDLHNLASLFANIKDDNERINSFWEAAGIRWGDTYLQYFAIIEMTFVNPPQSVLNESLNKLRKWIVTEYHTKLTFGSLNDRMILINNMTKDKNSYEYIDLLFRSIKHFNNDKRRYKSVIIEPGDEIKDNNNEEKYEFKDEDEIILGDFLQEEELESHPILSDLMNTERAVNAVKDKN